MIDEKKNSTIVANAKRASLMYLNNIDGAETRDVISMPSHNYPAQGSRRTASPAVTLN